MGSHNTWPAVVHVFVLVIDCTTRICIAGHLNVRQLMMETVAALHIQIDIVQTSENVHS
jgi:hypothetical protein